MTPRLLATASILLLAACDPRLPPSEDAPTPSGPPPPAEASPPPETPAHPEAPAEQAPLPPLVEASATQCVQGETHLYSCPMADGRIVSVCVGNRRVSYRFGPAGDPEIDLTVPAGQSGLWAGGGRQPHLRFRSGPYDYVVSSGRNDAGVERSGVTVLRDGDPIRRLSCPVTSSQTEIPAGMIPDYVPREPAGARADDWF